MHHLPTHQFGWTRHEPWIETRHAAEETRAFYARARADKMLAHWVAARLGLGLSQTQDYVDAVLHADIANRDHQAMLSMVAADLACVDPEDPDAHQAALAFRLAQFLARAFADLSAQCA